LEKIQQEIDKINDKETEEVMKIANKYNQLRKPHFQMRSKELEKIPDFWPQVVRIFFFGKVIPVFL
jgi:template-activating factor I